MMTKKRRRHSAEFKFRVALEAAKGLKTTSELAQEFAIHPNQISTWKQQLLKQGSSVFAVADVKERQEQEVQEAALYEQIGRLKVELEWLKKKAAQLE
jgi:putative transposase